MFPFVCMCVHACMCVRAQTQIHVCTHQSRVYRTHSRGCSHLHTCVLAGLGLRGGQVLKRDRTLDDLIDPLLHRSPVQGHTCPHNLRHVCLTYAQKCLQHTYPLPPKTQACPTLHTSTCAYLHTHPFMCGHACAWYAHVYMFTHRHIGPDIFTCPQTRVHAAHVKTCVALTAQSTGFHS